MITVWPGRVLCVWDDKGRLVRQEALTEPQARALVRDLLAGWDQPQVHSSSSSDVERDL